MRAKLLCVDEVKEASVTQALSWFPGEPPAFAVGSPAQTVLGNSGGREKGEMGSASILALLLACGTLAVSPAVHAVLPASALKVIFSPYQHKFASLYNS